MNTLKVTRRVRDLQIGDILSTGLEVVNRPVRSIRTPQGKHEVMLRQPANGRIGYRTWNSDTRITVTPLDTHSQT